ncbi:MAG: hypothetical protein JWM24_1441 [Solirubrobacterales bacterium]|nr:hypothetical protein [Solirubrobacterales bacterium]
MGGPKGPPSMLPSRKSKRTLTLVAVIGLVAALLLLHSVAVVMAGPNPKASGADPAKCQRHAQGRRQHRRARACPRRHSRESRTGLPHPGAGEEAEESAPLPDLPRASESPPAGGGAGPRVEGEPEAAPEPEAEVEPGPEPEPEVETESSEPKAETQSPALGTTPTRFFSPTSFWNSESVPSAILDPHSASITAAFRGEIEAEIAAGRGPWINTVDYGVPLVTVTASQPTVRVQLSSIYSAPALQAAWEEVPIPPHARPASGTDGTLVVWQPSTDRLWEFWHAAHTTTGWQAGWGGAIHNVSSASGAYGADAWAGAKPWWGSSASSISIAGGLITLKDLAHGSIDHALALAAPTVREGVYASPAMRTDGRSTSPLALPEGAHLRLDPSLNLEALHLPPPTLMLARAAQRYGIFLRDRSKIIHFFAQDPSSLAVNPYLGESGYFEGRTPAQLLASFPWGHLQLLGMDLHQSP